MRRRTITLVVTGLVMALFVLPAAAQVLNTEVEADEPVEYELTQSYDEENHIVFFGIAEVPEGEVPDGEEPLDCSIPDDVTVVVDPDTGAISFETDGDLFELSEECRAVNIEGPNGQVNHGQYVSNMVHALKDGYDKNMHGPFGQWVKQFAHDDEIGKGELKVKAEGDGDDLDELEADDADGDDGPPPWAGNKDKSKKKDK